MNLIEILFSDLGHSCRYTSKIVKIELFHNQMLKISILIEVFKNKITELRI